MASRPAIEVTGLSKVTRELKALEATAPKEIRQLNLQAARSALDVIRPLIPVKQADALGGQPAGALLKGVKAGATRRAGFVKMDTHAAKIPHAGPIHFGWPAHNIEAQPFMYEGLGQAEAGIVDDYQRGINELIRRVGL